MLLLLLQVIIFFPSIQLIYTAVNSSFSVPITQPYSLGLFIPRDLVKNLRDIFSVEVKMILYQRKCVRLVSVLMCSECGLL